MIFPQGCFFKKLLSLRIKKKKVMKNNALIIMPVFPFKLHHHNNLNTFK